MITIENIISTLKSKEKKIKDIKQEVYNNLTGGEQGVLFNDGGEQLDIISLGKEVERLIRDELKKGDESRIRKTGKGYKNAPIKRTPGDPITQIDKAFEGAAGETAVISELLFREFNANRMMVDKGIDVVASKDNVYRYIQVKTSYIKDDGRIIWSIKKERFDVNIQNALKYILVARVKERPSYFDPHESIDRCLFFILSDDDIKRGIAEKWIQEGVDNISIKVKFHPHSGEPIFYNGDKEVGAGYFLNSFNRV